MCHHARIFTTWEAFRSQWTTERFARRMWNAHIEKHGNVPFILKCAVCSGKERALDIKHGAYTPKRPSKRLRDELRGTQETSA